MNMAGKMTQQIYIFYVQKLELDFQDPLNGRREPNIDTNCPLTSAAFPQQMNKFNKNNKHRKRKHC